MSINHVIDQQKVPKYDLFCKDIIVDGDVNTTNYVNTRAVYVTNNTFISDASVNTDLIMTKDVVATSTIDGPDILIKCPDPIVDGFVDISTAIFRSVIRQKETSTKIIREYVFACISTPSSANITSYRLNFKPIVPFDTPDLDLNVTYLDFKVIDNGGATTCGIIDTSGNPGVGERTLVSSLFLGTLPSEGFPKTVLIKIVTNENKL